jgi:O-6-methylguanine DNA methyltransferase
MSLDGTGIVLIVKGWGSMPSVSLLSSLNCIPYDLDGKYCNSLLDSKMPKTSTELESQIRKGKLSAGMTFREQVWAITARIPRGKIVTYADVARSLKSTAYRAVGQALHNNPYAPGVPCHRVVGSDGRLTGFAQGLTKNAKCLKKRGFRSTEREST